MKETQSSIFLPQALCDLHPSQCVISVLDDEACVRQSTEAKGLGSVVLLVVEVQMYETDLFLREELMAFGNILQLILSEKC